MQKLKPTDFEYALANELKVDVVDGEFRDFAARHLNNIRSMWAVRATGHVPVKAIVNLAQVSSPHRWFYTPTVLVKGTTGTVWGAPRTGQPTLHDPVWAWTSDLYSPPGIEVTDDLGTLRRTLQFRHEKSYLLKARPRQAGKRQDRHAKIGISTDLTVVRCEEGLRWNLDCDAFMRALAVMDDEITVFVGNFTVPPASNTRVKRWNYEVVGIADAHRTWFVPLA